MYKLKHKILSLLLIPVVLFSTTSFTLSEHECAGSITSVSLIGNADSCGMVEETTFEGACIMNTDTCDNMNAQDTPLLKKDLCCEDINLFYPGSSIHVENDSPLTKLQTVFLVAYNLSYLNLFNDLNAVSVNFNHYIPPLIFKNISVLHQVFQI